MNRIIRKSLGLFAAVVGCALCSTSKAQTITATLTGLQPDTFGHVFLNGAGSLDGGIGNILWQGNSGNVAPFNGAFNTYCIDLIQDINFGSSYSFTITPLAQAPKASAFPGGTPANGMGATKATEIMELFGQQYASTQGTSSTDLNNAEAFQLAVWNIIYDTDASVSNGSGTFYAGSDVSSTAINTANTFLADALSPTDQALYQATDLVALVGQNGAQDQIAVNPLLNVGGSTPLPPASVGGGLLLALVAAARWRKARILASL